MIVLRFIVVILFSIFFGQINAQQWVQFTQQGFYGSYINPAFTGYNSTLNATLAHRSQYVGLGSKTIGTQFLSFSAPIFSPKFGLGVRLINDFIGFQRYTNAELTAACHLNFKKHKLSIGLSAGFVQLTIDGSKLTTPDGTYLPGTVVHNDDYLPNVKSSGIAPNISAGILYSVSNFQLGIAAQQLTQPNINISNSQNGTIIFLNRTINMYTSYVISLKNVKFKPSLYAKTDFIKLQAQMDLVFEWRKILFGGGFRGYTGLNNDAVFGIFGLKLKDKIKVAYSYDFNVSYLNNANSGSHEISLLLDLPKVFNPIVNNNLRFNPRFL